MQFPLRYQIALPMAGVMLATIIAVSGLNAYLAARQAKETVERQVRELARTLDNASFPLTDPVLQQMHGLSGADFVLVDSLGRIVASSRVPGVFSDLPEDASAVPWSQIGLGPQVTLGDTGYFHSVLRLEQRRTAEAPHQMHILYPVVGYNQAWRTAVIPPLAIGGVAILIVVLIAVAASSRLSRPIAALRTQVEKIAAGDFAPVPLPDRDDEIRDLTQSFNRMAELLAQYEGNVRRTERLRTLAQLGGGMAHQMRNSATGCRMALDLHSQECAVAGQCDSLIVAKRQLELIEKYLQRFLSLGKFKPKKPEEEVRFDLLVSDLLPLVRPAAQHACVNLQWRCDMTHVVVRGDSDELEQLVINLLLNAIEAASGSQPHPESQIIVHLRPLSHDRVEFSVLDSGDGPAAAIESTLFEPFVTGKRDGTGLGLAVASEVVQRHRGTLDWTRRDGMTCFAATLPVLRIGNGDVEVTCS